MAEEANSKRNRASGEVLDYLLREFEVNHNPTPDQRKEISERTNMSEKAVRIWFQNRRAKLRKFEKMGKSLKSGSAAGTHSNSPYGKPGGSVDSSRSNSYTNLSSSAAPTSNPHIPTELNENYCFIDCSSLSVGSWQRIKSGVHDPSALSNPLVNLSPFTLNSFMSNVDLMVILSRKNNEINYFFSAVSENSKILFRIFYPVSSVVSCSLLDNSISKENNELRLSLSHTPKFSVYFFSGANSNLNQWSICEDFSEGQQVSSAIDTPGGPSTPHVLVGVKSSLEMLNVYITENNHGGNHMFDSAGPDGLVNGMDSGFHDTETPDNDFHGIAQHHDLPMATGDIIPSDHQQDNGDFQIKHANNWIDPSKGEHDFALKGISSAANFDTQSPASATSHHSTDGNGEFAGEAGTEAVKKEEYGDIFSETPNFFNSVQTPGTNVDHSQTQEHDDLIHSPSTNIHPFTNTLEKNHALGSERKEEYPPSTFASELAQKNGLYAHGSSGEHNYYGESNDFRPDDLIVNSPHIPGSGHAEPDALSPNGNIEHVEKFIDYNADT